MDDFRSELETCKKRIKELELETFDLMMRVEEMEDTLYQQEYSLFGKVVCFPAMNEN